MRNFVFMRCEFFFFLMNTFNLVSATFLFVFFFSQAGERMCLESIIPDGICSRPHIFGSLSLAKKKFFFYSF